MTLPAMDASPADLLAGLEPVPRQRPPRHRPIALPSWTVLHGGCRWVQPNEMGVGASPHWGLSWIDRPEATLRWTAGGRRHQARQNADVIVLFPPGLVVERRISGACIQFYLALRLSLACRPDRPLLHPLGPTEAALVRTCAGAQIARQPPTAVEAVATTALVALVCTSLPAASWQVGPADVRIRSAIDRMQADPCTAWDNAALARAAGLSLGRFLRLFQAETGTSPQRLLRDLRLDRAAEALRRGEPLKAVGPACGWRDRAAFSAAFRQRFGQPPGTWARQIER
ncbi:hypothetical protein LBMAG53_17670 [Planctomycetota bacterium]|nr:hypothetical protein LBMAG53_17670 [Planctomycetota bacterium]